MSLGKERVRVSFNPSSDLNVDEIKAAAAELIDMCDQPTEDPEVKRLWALAMTHFEDGAMWAVKAATYKVK